jgi:hypothetical protein
MRSVGARAVVGLCALAAIALVVVNVVRALGLFEQHRVYWALNVGLAVLFWILLLRASWTERRQRPR